MRHMDIDHFALLVLLLCLFARIANHSRLRQANLNSRRGSSVFYSLNSAVARNSTSDLRTPGARRDGFFLEHVWLCQPVYP